MPIATPVTKFITTFNSVGCIRLQYLDQQLQILFFSSVNDFGYLYTCNLFIGSNIPSLGNCQVNITHGDTLCWFNGVIRRSQAEPHEGSSKKTPKRISDLSWGGQGRLRWPTMCWNRDKEMSSSCSQCCHRIPLCNGLHLIRRKKWGTQKRCNSLRP